MADVNKYAYIAIKEDGHAVAKLHMGGKIQIDQFIVSYKYDKDVLFLDLPHR